MCLLLCFSTFHKKRSCIFFCAAFLSYFLKSWLALAKHALVFSIAEAEVLLVFFFCCVASSVFVCCWVWPILEMNNSTIDWSSRLIKSNKKWTDIFVFLWELWFLHHRHGEWVYSIQLDVHNTAPILIPPIDHRHRMPERQPLHLFCQNTGNFTIVICIASLPCMKHRFRTCSTATHNNSSFPC